MTSIRQDHGQLIQIDGIDGAGKSTLLEAAKAWTQERGMIMFDVVAWSKREQRLPDLSDIGEADMLITAEPTHTWIGAGIRNEIIRQGAPYDAEIAAEAFALDRAVHYRRILLPFLQAKPGRWIVCERGLFSSLAYQPLQDEMNPQPNHQALTIERLLALSGNRIALENPPDVFVFLDLDPKIALERLSGRTEKIDNHVYETTTFQTRLASRYHLSEVTNPLTQRGTHIELIDGAKSKEEVAGAMKRILENLNHRS